MFLSSNSPFFPWPSYRRYLAKKTFFPTLVPRTFRQLPVFTLDYFVPSFALSLQHCFPGGDMSATRVLILGHSFIRRLREYVGRNAALDANLNILEDIELKWHGVGGRTVLKTVQFDLSVVVRFKPDIVILQLGTNDLNHLSPVNVGPAIEDLTRSLHDSLKVKCVCVCQTIYRTGAPTFNKNVILLNRTGI